jgi:uroporphyrinogen III methyltransferase/synthase
VSSNSGRVSLIGSGPGDPDLITVRAVNCLETADVVFHDKLSPGELIERYCDPSVVVRDVGKRKGKDGPSQSEINERLLEASRNHDHVVRLKGGDPYLFGRGGEEAKFLEEHDVPFEVIPGISSLLAVPNYAGIPATERRHSSSMAVFTGHLGSRETKLPWSALAEIDTLVAMMGITRCETIAGELIDAGRAPDTPVAVIGWGTTPRQASTTMTLRALSENGLEERSRFLPGLIVIGEVVTERERLNWFERRPLFGRRIIVTRPAHQIQGIANELRERGAKPLKAPTIEIEPIEDGLNDLREEFDRLDSLDWLVFTSRNGVAHFFEQLREYGGDTRDLGGLRTAAIGEGTANSMEDWGCTADLVPDTFRAEALADTLNDTANVESRFLLPRADGARPVLPDRLEEQDHEVREIPLYRSVVPEDSRPRFEQWIEQDEADMITFTSASTVDNLFRMFETRHDDLREWLSDLDIATIGPITASRLRERDLEVDVIPDEYTIDGLVEAVETFYRTHPPDGSEVET